MNYTIKTFANGTKKKNESHKINKKLSPIPSSLFSYILTPYNFTALDQWKDHHLCYYITLCTVPPFPMLETFIHLPIYVANYSDVIHKLTSILNQLQFCALPEVYPPSNRFRTDNCRQCRKNTHKKYMSVNQNFKIWYDFSSL